MITKINTLIESQHEDHPIVDMDCHDIELTCRVIEYLAESHDYGCEEQNPCGINSLTLCITFSNGQDKIMSFLFVLCGCKDHRRVKLAQMYQQIADSIKALDFHPSKN